VTHIAHIVAKDVRRLRWLLIGWSFIIAGSAALAIVQGRLEFTSTKFARIVDETSFLLVIVEVLAFVAIVSSLVHDDSLVGLDAFWVTRPIAPAALLAAKLAVAAVVLVALPLAGEVAILAILGPGWGDALRVPAAFAILQSVWVLGLIALAVMTPSLTRLIVAIVLGAVAVIVLLVATGIVTTLAQPASPDTPAREFSMLSDRTSPIVALAILACGSAAVIVYQFLHRRARIAIAIAVATIAAVFLVPEQWPWRFAKPAEPDPGAWAHDPSRTFAAIDPAVPPNGFAQPGPGQRIDIAAPASLHGQTPDYTVQLTSVDSRFELPNGLVFSSTQVGDHPVQHVTKRPSPDLARLQAILGPVRFLSDFDPESQISMPVLFTIDSTLYERFRREAGRLTATMDFYLRRSTLVGSLPFREGAVLHDGRRWFMVAQSPAAETCCRVLMRWSDVAPLWAADESVQYEFILRNQAAGEAIAGKTAWFPEAASLQFGSLSVGTIERSDSLFHSTVLTYQPTDPLRLDRDWLGRAEIAVIQTRYAGHIRRPLTVERFIMSPEK
jgi:hypothetical protein